MLSDLVCARERVSGRDGGVVLTNVWSSNPLYSFLRTAILFPTDPFGTGALCTYMCLPLVSPTQDQLRRILDAYEMEDEVLYRECLARVTREENQASVLAAAAAVAAAGGEGEGAKKTSQLVGFLETQGLMGGRSGVDEKVETGERTASADRSTVDLI